MNPTTWSLEDGQLLQNLRTQAGVDAHVFARNNTISLAQLRELESGEGQNFYNEPIKRNTGIKLLKKLGYQFPSPPIQERAVLNEALHAVVDHDNALVASPAGAANGHPASWHHAILKHPLFVMGVLLAIGGLGFMGLQLQAPAPSAPHHTASLPNETPQPSSSSAATPAPAAEPPAAWTEGAATAAQRTVSNLNPLPISVAPASEAPQPASLSCEEQHRHHSLSHTPRNPLKPGNYIYIEARTDSQLCVLDSQNRLFTFTLKAGTNQTVNGEAPFLVHANNWQGLQVFFQGRPVRFEHGGHAHLLLNSLPL